MTKRKSTICRDIVEELINEVEKHEITPQTVLYLCSRIRVAEDENRRKDEQIDKLVTRISEIQKIGFRVLEMLRRTAPEQVETKLLENVLVGQRRNSTGNDSSNQSSSQSQSTAQRVDPL